MKTPAALRLRGSCATRVRDPQHVPPARTRKNASMSPSVATSPSPLKSALLMQGGAGQFPARHAKNDSMSASVAVSPSQLKSADPQGGRQLFHGTATISMK